MRTYEMFFVVFLFIEQQDRIGMITEVAFA